jgi:hypothetical protein
VLAGPRFFRAATEARDTSAILSYLHALPASAPNTFTYQHAITACRKLHDMAATFSVLNLMYDRGTPPDSHHCSNALAVCKHGGEVDQAFVWFARMTSAGTAPDTHMLAALASVCSARIRTLRAVHKRAHSCDINVSLQVCIFAICACPGVDMHACIGANAAASNQACTLLMPSSIFLDD